MLSISIMPYGLILNGYAFSPNIGLSRKPPNAEASKDRQPIVVVSTAPSGCFLPGNDDDAAEAEIGICGLSVSM